MSKFNKLVELAKERIENYIIHKEEGGSLVLLPTNGEYLIWYLGGDWYYEAMLSAGYSHYTAHRKVENMDYDKLVSALDDWYKTELFPKLYNKFKSEGRPILDSEGKEILDC